MTTQENILQEKTISTGTAARILNISGRTVRYYCETGELRGYKLGKRWHIVRASLDQLVTRRMNVPIIKESAMKAVTAGFLKREPVKG